MRFFILIIFLGIGTLGWAQPQNIHGFMAMEAAYYQVKFNDIGVMVNPTSPDTQGPDDSKKLSFGGALSGGAVFPFAKNNDWKSGLRLSGGLFIHHIQSAENSADGASRLSLQAKALGYLNFTPQGSGLGLVFGPKYNLGPFPVLTGVVGLEYVGDEDYSFMIYTTTNPYKLEYDLSNGGTSNVMTLRELIGFTLVMYP